MNRVHVPSVFRTQQATPNVFRNREDLRRQPWPRDFQDQLYLIRAHQSWRFMAQTKRWGSGLKPPRNWKEDLVTIAATAGFIVLLCWKWI